MSDEKDDASKPAEEAAPKAEDKAEASADVSEAPAKTADPEAVVEKAPGPKPSDRGHAPAAWGLPLAKLDKKWTKLEAQLCAGVLIAEILALCMWISLKGLSSEYTSGGDRSGLLFRGILGAVAFGLIAQKLTKPKDESNEAQKKKNAIVVTGSIIVGFSLAFAWTKVGVSYFSNLLNWMQSGSLLTLVGGLRGVATRLTLWLALLGASLATAQGKHINIDVVMRFLSPKLRVPVAVIGWLAAATMCTAAIWGFVDHIAIEAFHAPAIEPCAADPNQSCDVAPGVKIAFVGHAMESDLFLVGRQISLDVRTFPRVIMGTRFSDYLTAGEWNTWLDGANWSAHFAKEDVEALKMQTDPPGQTHLPIISIPGSPENVPGMLVKELDFVFPLGLLAIALRFVLRSLLVIAGVYTVDPDAVHGEDEVDESQDEQHSEPKKEVTI